MDWTHGQNERNAVKSKAIISFHKCQLHGFNSDAANDIFP